jgi:hypothetical protein
MRPRRASPLAPTEAIVRLAAVAGNASQPGPRADCARNDRRRKRGSWVMDMRGLAPVPPVFGSRAGSKLKVSLVFGRHDEMQGPRVPRDQEIHPSDRSAGARGCARCETTWNLHASRLYRRSLPFKTNRSSGNPRSRWRPCRGPARVSGVLLPLPRPAPPGPRGRHADTVAFSGDEAVAGEVELPEQVRKTLARHGCRHQRHDTKSGKD